MITLVFHDSKKKPNWEVIVCIIVLVFTLLYSLENKLGLIVAVVYFALVYQAYCSLRLHLTWNAKVIGCFTSILLILHVLSSGFMGKFDASMKRTFEPFIQNGQSYVVISYRQDAAICLPANADFTEWGPGFKFIKLETIETLLSNQCQPKEFRAYRFASSQPINVIS